MSPPFKMRGWSPFTQVDPDITQELKPLSKQQLKVIKQNYDAGHSVGYEKGVSVGHKRGIEKVNLKAAAEKNLAMQKAFEAGRGGFWKRTLRRFWPAALGIAAWEGIQRYKDSKKKKPVLKQN